MQDLIFPVVALVFCIATLIWVLVEGRRTRRTLARADAALKRVEEAGARTEEILNRIREVNADTAESIEWVDTQWGDHR